MATSDIDRARAREDGAGFCPQELLCEVSSLLNRARYKNWGGDLSAIRIWDIERTQSVIHADDPVRYTIILTTVPECCPLVTWLNRHLDEKRFPHVSIEGFG